MADHWYDDAIVYAVEVKTFRDADGDGVGDFRGLTEKLPYIAGLGVNCIWLAPFFPSPWRDDGYDVADFEAIDPRLGTAAEFDAFVARAEDLGIRVVADLVVNHTSDQHPWFRAARADRSSPYRDFYLWSDTEPADARAGVVFPGEQETTWSHDPVAGAYYHHRFYPFQPDLNTGNEEVKASLRDTVRFWLHKGLAGYRLDAAPFLVEHRPELGKLVTSFRELREAGVENPYGFLDDLRRAAAEARADAVLVAEANVAMAEVPDYFGPDASRMQMMFNFLLNQYLALALARGEAEPLRRGLSQIPPAPANGQWLNYLRNHDEMDLGRLAPAERDAVFAAFAPEERMRIYGRGVRRRIASMLGGDRRRIQMAYSLLFALPGTAMFRYGDEIGMGEDLGQPSRLPVRTPMQWASTPNGGFSAAPADRLVRPVIAGGPYGYETVNVDVQELDPGSLLHFMRRLIRVRTDCPEIGRGMGTALNTGDPTVFGLRCAWRGRAVVSLHNLADRPGSVSVDPAALGGRLAGVFGGDERFDAPGRLDLEGYGYRWFRVET